MTNIIVEHEWSSDKTEDVFKVVGAIVEMSKSGQLPEGFKLNSVNVLSGQTRAVCNWEAPSSEALSELMSKVDPPTTHKVNEAQKIL